MEKEEEIVEQLKQISSKFDALNKNEEDKTFQLNMLEVQVKQSNIVMLLTVVVSVSVSFFVGYLTVLLTGVVPTSILDVLPWTIGLMDLVFVGIFSVIWLILHRLIMKQIDSLRPKKVITETR